MTPSSTRSVCVAGASGLVGSNIVKACLEDTETAIGVRQYVCWMCGASPLNDMWQETTTGALAVLRKSKQPPKVAAGHLANITLCVRGKPFQL